MKKQEEKVFTEVIRHYDMAKQDLETRMSDFDKADELFRSYIDETDWPYSAMIFLPRIFTALFEKTSRLIGKKPKGRLIPREGSDVLGARVNNALLDYQWDDSTRVDGTPMVAKWALMDTNARKYGASFALIKWHKEKKGDKVCYDGPTMKLLNNRDVLANPSYSTVKTWFQHREYLTLDELLNVNDKAPIYKNLSELRTALKNEMKTMDTRESNYLSRNKSIKGYSEYLGRDEYNKVVEVVTEYRDDRWISFCPNHGVVIRDCPNPYNHKEIPVIMLKYYPIDDDLYGICEWEPVEKTQKAINALASQYVDAVNIELHAPLGIDSTRVRMHTMEFGPGKKWITTGDPKTAIHKFDFGSPSAIGSFKTIYSVLVGEMSEALGETSAMQSMTNPFKQDKTATEIMDSAQQRLARDNYNQIYLSEAIKQQMLFWFAMNQQFFLGPNEQEKVIRIVGRDAISWFREQGLGDSGLGDDVTQLLGQATAQELNINPADYEEPLYPVETGEGVVPKLEEEAGTDSAKLHIVPDDMAGTYDYIPDIGTMQPPSGAEEIMAKKAAVDMAINPHVKAQLAEEGKGLSLGDLLVDYFDELGFKDAEKYFTNSPQQQYGGQEANQAGGGVPEGGQPYNGDGLMPGMGGVPEVSGAENQEQLAGPPPM